MLLDLIELQFQNKPSSAFQAHPITTKVAAATLLLFVSPFGLELTSHSYSAALLRTAIATSGSLFTGFLGITIVPDT
ncbi:hypothetical protein CK203_026449 [Vitis vinifera]|uniref:Uncharacterized protein n=1 Tax=Vitis vinifera TaxID=29760 RepID=A0A438IW85_VITVI|nr:hypothetical protein CK203_026449 [Vitis vinifera]